MERKLNYNSEPGPQMLTPIEQMENFLVDTLDLLKSKNTEYGATGLFHNFETGASMLHVSREEALAGMMVKHTTSVYDMIRDPHNHSLDKWDEKIGDHINYLLLLRAMIIDNHNKESIMYADNLRMPIVD